MSGKPGPSAERFEVRFADGKVESCASLWAARHAVARRVAFDTDPTDPRSVIPAEIWKNGPALFGRGVFVERIESPADLSASG